MKSAKATSRTPKPATIDVPFRGGSLSVAYLHRPGRKETLLYLHGLGSTKQDFGGAWAVPEWSEYTLVAFDAPGCGETRGYRNGVLLGVDDIVRVAQALVDRLGLEGITVIGHSMGGLAGLLFSLRNARAVTRFASVEGNLGPEDCALYSRRVFQQRFLGWEREFFEDLERELRASGAAGTERAADTLRANVHAHAFFDYCRSIVEYSDHAPLRDEFVGLACARLYVHGEENDHLSHPAYLAERGVPVAAVPRSNHFPAWSNPDAYYRVLVDFIGAEA
ncbi:MAG: alpha/beta hydrolase [Gemmatimonadota bacterium]